MRVITGSRRGKKLKTLDTLDTRPTTDMVKEAVFSAIQFDVAGSQVLDLFAGSGQMGIEALSRDASHCVFVDNNPAAVQIIKENISDCKLVAQSRVLNMDSLDYLKVAKGQFDIVLLDPPYGKGIIEKVLTGLEGKLSERAIVVCEHEKELELGEEYGILRKHKRYKYGKIAVTIFKVPAEEE
ncbi:16S rRNA (guanine(966)-N(2))-methyltransferase RsmD [Ruminococcus sp.]|uniref:16S rRNA (guanine(966)-N(2))-methyltransferase RsmD n=1 Tax=Ruminococcus sp. TaxID=41978 RepID=UPI0025E10F11|nr:16S rRNA (guanine(966)-N(2))-methyltransferase RsmD [Ruminococcus sp.]MBQ8965558.1 16S rRNA (guanine(966)-N(2))-methyltransferase RsmD [Ruminococcus sp.]